MAVSAYQTSRNGNGEQGNDLTTIRGIGATKKRWLASFGIYTIADLAHTSVDEIEAQLKNNGHSISCGEIEGWIAQAQALQAKWLFQTTESSANLTEAEADCPFCFDGGCEEVTKQPEEITEASTTNPVAINPEEETPAWTTTASFTIAYQTKPFVPQTEQARQTEQRILIRHIETDTIETWADTETELPQQWMRDRLEASLPEAEAEQVIVPEIIQLCLIQPSQMGHPMVADRSRPFFSDAVKRGEPFALEATLKIDELATFPLTKSIAYRIHCRARNLHNSMTLSLGDITTQIPFGKNSSHKVLVPDLIFQHPGIYRLKVFIGLPSQSTTSTYFRIPMLQVI